jgi:hypothetical protein
MKLKISDEYEIIGEVSQNIFNNAKKKFSQQFNYIHLIKEFNKYEKKDDPKFISLCKTYELNNKEKIFILFTDGSYIRLKYLINVMNKNMNEIESLINEKKPKNEIINKLSKYCDKNDAKNILDINIENFYNLCLFYNHLKVSGIKFCFCFISDIIEDKLENRIEERIKIYLNDDIYNKKNINKEEKYSKQNNNNIDNEGKYSKQNNNNIENYSEQKDDDKNKEEKCSGENYDGWDEKRKERNEFI